MGDIQTVSQLSTTIKGPEDEVVYVKTMPGDSGIFNVTFCPSHQGKYAIQIYETGELVR